MIQKTSLTNQRISPIPQLNTKWTQGQKCHPTTIKVIIAKLDGGSNSHVFNKIKLFAYIRPIQCNIQIINGRKAPAKGFGLFIMKYPKKIIIPL